MKTRILSIAAFVSVAATANVCGGAALPDRGPENEGLRLRLVITPTGGTGKEGYDVRIEVLNVSEQDLTLRAAWMYENDDGDLQDYLAAAASIESYPTIEPLSNAEGRPPPRPWIVLSMSRFELASSALRCFQF